MTLLIKALILTSSLAMAATLSQNKANYVGCISTRLGLCVNCFRRKAKQDGTCGSLQPDSDPCLMYIYSKEQKGATCVQCKPGYANTFNINDPNGPSKCLKGRIKGCLYEVLATALQKKDDFCYGCEDDKYAVLDPNTKKVSCIEIQSPVPNCLWGGLYAPSLEDKECYRCLPGYAANLISGVCEKAVQEGCFTQVKGGCDACDPFSGWSMDPKGNCFKPGSARLRL